MKKTIITIVAMSFLACILLIPASAVNYEIPAEQLNELGLFRGTDAGFELDRAPTRAEAVTMLVRFLGLEEESKSGEYTHPFSDVPKWADEAVAIAFEKGYTTGVTDTKFDPQGICSAQMYVTFILRALGYSDDSVESTLWAEAIEFGKNVGIIDDIILSGTFLRGNMTAVSYLALKAAPQDSEYDTLLEKLFADGAVDEITAQLVAIWLIRLEEYSNIMTGFTKDTSLAASITMSINATDGDDVVSSSTSIDVAAIFNENDLNLTLVMASDDGIDETYITNGNVYVNSNGEKIKVPLETLSGTDMENLLSFIQITNIPPTPPYLISNVGMNSQDDSVVYTIKAVGGPLAELMHIVFTSFGGNLSLDDFSAMLDGSIVMAFSVDEDGLPTKITVSAALDYFNISGTLSFEVEFIAFGAGVKIDFPDDLDTYIDMAAEMAEHTS